MDSAGRNEIRETCLFVDAAGPPVGDPASARDLVEAAMNEGARLIVLPVERLDPEFLRLRSGMAGEFMQKVLNYRMQLAIVGDVSAQVAESDALRDFIVECDRGSEIYFAADVDALLARVDRP